MTDIWTAVLWAEKPGRRPASPAQPPCMITAKPVPISAASPTVPHPSPAPMKNAPDFGIKPDVNPATTGTKAPKPVQPNVPMNALSPAAPHLSPAPMKTAPVNTAKPDVEDKIISGMKQHKPARVHLNLNIHVPALDITNYSKHLKNAMESSKGASVMMFIFGMIPMRFALKTNASKALNLDIFYTAI